VGTWVVHYGESVGVMRESEWKAGAIQQETSQELTFRRRNVVNPMVGCGMQQARGARAEQAVEAGWNGKDGTSREVADPDRWERVGPRTRGITNSREWTLEAYVDEGAVFGQPHERRRIQRTGGKQISVCKLRPSGASSTGPPDREQPLVKTTRCVTCLRRGSEDHEGPSISWLTRAGCRTIREVPRRSRSSALRRR
jgi:hypothetical protein